MNALALLVLACGGKTPPETAVEAAPEPELAARGDVVETLHGVEVADPYRWMEDADAEAVQAWTQARRADFTAYTDAMPQHEALYQRFQHLWRYDDESVPSPCLLSDRIVYQTKDADQDKWVVHLKDGPDDEAGRIVLDPNTWESTETLAFFNASPDCSLATYGVAKAGDENPVLHVLNLDTLEVLPDTVQGWKQYGSSWSHDNSGFYYSSKPLAGEVPAGDEYYFHRVMYHALGSDPAEDTLVLGNPDVKEHYHGAWLSEDGEWLLLGRYNFSTNAMWIERADGSGERMALVEEIDSSVQADVVGDTLYILTDWEAPNYRLMTASTDKPGREHWTELLPEREDAVMDSFSLVDGKLYVSYQEKAATRLAVHEPDGRYLHDIALPTLGSAGVWGYWSKPTTWLSFSSYAFPSTVYTYDAASNALSLYKESPVDFDPSGMEVSQVFYPSKDGTEVSMFIVHAKDMPLDGTAPTLLTGYGGFNISMNPGFSTVYGVWVESGGVVAIPNLRGGGEYGKEWHEGGMREHKQNVFDDFIAAAEYLGAEGWSDPERIAIAGGSNGGLLVSAVVVQRPELFEAVLCQVPLTDMVRFHTFGLANIWTEEYGSADDPEMFPYIYAYSPYHNVQEGTNYPAILVTGSENDARTDPVHARKFFAAVRWADVDHGAEQPILLSIQGESGHGGGVTIDTKADQTARNYGFLMHQLGMSPAAPVAPEDAAAE
ncbi:MAG: S9 family peptidase [Alphaproteobacteria bacterium]|nr:S9 family peptidase [Alphaproteobacteria bacterium]